MVPTLITDWISALSAVGGTLIAVVAAYLVYKQYLQPLAQEAEPDVAIDGTAASMNSKLVVFDTSKQRTLLKIGSQGLECWLFWTVAARRNSSFAALRYNFSDANLVCFRCSRTTAIGKWIPQTVIEV